MKITVGCDKIKFYGPVSTPISDLTTSKIHWNSAPSTPGSKYLVVDIKNFYLNNPMSRNEFYKIAIILITKDIIDK